MLVISHHGRPAAYVTTSQVRLAPRVEAVEPDHPTRRWILCMAFFAHDVLNAELPGPYRPVRAEHFARCVLMPDAEFRALAWRSDVTLAEQFIVPVDQIAKKRLDLEALGVGGR